MTVGGGVGDGLVDGDGDMVGEMLGDGEAVGDGDAVGDEVGDGLGVGVGGETTLMPTVILPLAVISAALAIWGTPETVASNSKTTATKSGPLRRELYGALCII